MISTDRPVIICIVGPSGSGKTTLAKHLLQQMGIPMLVSYTTRPIRDNEVDGVDHWFVSENDMPDQSKMLAYTQFGGHHYWMPITEVPGNGLCTYVIDEKGVRFLEEKYGKDFHIFSVLIKRSIESLISQVGEDRVMRDLEREQIPEAEYSLVLENYGDLNDFLNNSTKIFKNIFD